MRKIILTFIALASIAANAQRSEKRILTSKSISPSEEKAMSTASVSNLYTFSTFTAPYVAITGTSLTNGQKWDETDLAIPLGFNFDLYNKQSNTYTLYFGGQFISPDDFSSASDITAAGAMYEDLCDRAFDVNNDNEGDPGGLSPISYETTGTPGNRICKIQISNAAFYGELSNSALDTSVVNFQIWLYETTNDVEFRYGFVDIKNQNDNLSNGSLGFTTGMANQVDMNTLVSNGGSNMLQGSSSSPSVTTWSPNFDTYVSPTITFGRVYRFQRNAVNTSLAENTGLNGIQIFPNPAFSGTLVQLKGLSNDVNKLVITDLAGKIIFEKSIIGNTMSLDGVEAGVYFVEVYSMGHLKSKTKLVVID